jgi:hypothetical protein
MAFAKLALGQGRRDVLLHQIAAGVCLAIHAVFVLTAQKALAKI